MFINTKLGEFLDLCTYGFTNPMPDSDEGPWKVTAKDVIGGKINYRTARKTTLDAFNDELTSKSKPRVNDVLLTKDGTLGRIAIVKKDGICINQSVALLRTNEKMLPQYLYYVLTSPEIQQKLIGDSDGSVLKHIYVSRVPKMVVDVPDIQTQKAIAHILGSLDDKIELNRQMNETLESMAQALFKSWFVDFDPIIDNALAAGNTIPDVFAERSEQRKVLKNEVGSDQNYQSLFPSEFEFTEEMGWVPKGWKQDAIENILQINPRIPLKKGAVARFADMKALPTSGYTISEVIDKEYSGGAKFQKGDVLFARITPCLENGKTGIANFLKDEEVGFGSTEFIVLRGKTEIKTPFVACLARDSNFRTHAKASMVGSSGRQRVQNACFSDYYLALPTDSELLKVFHSLTEPNFSKSHKLSLENTTLTKLRDTLLPKLLSGEHRVPDAEKLIDEVNA